MELIQSEEQKEKKNKRVGFFKGLMGHHQEDQYHFINVPERQKRDKGAKR